MPPMTTLCSSRPAPFASPPASPPCWPRGRTTRPLECFPLPLQKLSTVSSLRMTTKIPGRANRSRPPHVCPLGKFLAEDLHVKTILTPASDYDIHSANLPSEALEEFLSILRPSSFLYPSPTSPILRRRNNGTMIHYDRQQSTRKGENAWSPQPPSPTKTVKTLTPDDFVSAERLDSDHDLSSITWYPFDWRTGGPNPTYSPLRKLLTYPPLPSYLFVFN